MSRTVYRIDVAARIQHLRWMILGRVADERIALMYRQGRFPGKVFIGKGQEALSAALGMCLRPPGAGRPGDIFAPLIRDMAGRLAFGEQLVEIARVQYMRRTSTMRGRDGNIHRGDVERGMLPMISHLGSMVSVVCGALLARRLRGDLGDRIGATCIGDGGMQTGACHEGLNMAAIERLPLVLVVADNQYSYSTTTDRTYACRSLVDRAIGYGVRGYEIDGTDADACLRTLTEAVARARAGEGPQMVVATLLRGSGHGEHDDASYVPDSVKAKFPDCLAVHERRMLEQGIVTEGDLVAWRNEANAQIQEAFRRAADEPDCDPETAEWDCYASRDLATRLQPRSGEQRSGGHA